jgi:hypothetical protein
VERYCGAVMSRIRRLVDWVLVAEWYYILQDILWGLRALPLRVMGVSPFFLLFKQNPRCQDKLELSFAEPSSEWATAKEEDALFQMQIEFWRELKYVITERL